ncbi:putative threonine--tRNA ligase 1 [uncultured archaeon]|nr:putative threonine--tRNA ligase 1 [uncultured archaeon]
MSDITLTLPDGKALKVPAGATVLDAAKLIGPKLAQVVVAAKLDEQLVDLSHKVERDAKFVLFKPDSGAGLEVFRHSSAHVMAQAVRRLYPQAQLTIGPVVEEGFYYDIGGIPPLSPEDLARVEAEMKKIVEEDQPFVRREMSKKDALALYPDNKYKRELIEGIPGDMVSVYFNSKTAKTPSTPATQAAFFDLCSGPHIPSTGRVKAFKLMKVAGAYWRANAENDQLQRIYGISFDDEKKLAEYTTRLEEAEKRDHRKVGSQLGLIHFSELAPGMPFLLPKGMAVRNELEKFWREEHRKAGYQEIKTPIIMNEQLWHQSGHWDHYKENMYFTQIDEQPFAVKPMNCPGAMLVFGSTARSYRELPLRLGEMGLVHRHELSGVLSGMVRVRAFTQDDSHLFVMPEQIEQEVKGVISLIDKFYKTFGFEYTAELSTRPDKFMGEPETWDRAEASLKAAMDSIKLPYTINAGDGAFYGPKIDFKIKDAIGRSWQCATCQLDFQMPQRFNLSYTGADDKPHTPVVIHRVIYGSMERFMGILIEHYAGAFPPWLAPVQIAILPIAKDHLAYAKALHAKFEQEGLRSVLDERDDTIASKIRDAQMQKMPYMLAVGKNEIDTGRLAVRDRKGKIVQMQVDEFVKHMKMMMKEKKQIE